MGGFVGLGFVYYFLLEIKLFILIYLYSHIYILKIYKYIIISPWKVNISPCSHTHSHAYAYTHTHTNTSHSSMTQIAGANISNKKIGANGVLEWKVKLHTSNYLNVPRSERVLVEKYCVNSSIASQFNYKHIFPQILYQIRTVKKKKRYSFII